MIINTSTKPGEDSRAASLIATLEPGALRSGVRGPRGRFLAQPVSRDDVAPALDGVEARKINLGERCEARGPRLGQSTDKISPIVDRLGGNEEMDGKVARDRGGYQRDPHGDQRGRRAAERMRGAIGAAVAALGERIRERIDVERAAATLHA